MAKSLVIVESPAKAKTINKYLGKNFDVEASLGHVKDLPKSGLAVDVDNNFATELVIIPGKEKVMASLKKKAAKAEAVNTSAMDTWRKSNRNIAVQFPKASPRMAVADLSNHTEAAGDLI